MEAITANPSNQITAVCWDAVTLERLLSVPRSWAIAQRFLPKSAGLWRLYATERPNDFVAHYNGYVIHLTNRVGSRADHQLVILRAWLTKLENIKLPKGQLLRPRSVFHDDKNGPFYHWYVDYMYPIGTEPSLSEAEVLTFLDDGLAWDDGDVHTSDLKLIEYIPMSDHFDRDHYEYYVRYLPNFLEGSDRGNSNWTEYFAFEQQLAELNEKAMAKRNVAFEAMVDAFRNLPFLKVMRAVNVQIEHIHRFERRFSWSDVIKDLKIDIDCLFNTLLVLGTDDEEKFHSLLSRLPIDMDGMFRASRVFVYVPGHELVEQDSIVYDIRLTVHPCLIANRDAGRETFDAYFDRVRTAVETFASQQPATS